MAYTISSCFTAAFLLTIFTTVHASYRPLNPLEQLQKRNPYYGGYALPEPSLGCPANLETCDGNFCCPTGTWCSPAINGPYCCPTEADCYTQVADLPTCADPSWRLFKDVYMWCCTGTDVGVYGAQCVGNDVTFSADQYADTETQANTALPPATRVGATGSAATTTSGGSGAGATAGTKPEGGGIGGIGITATIGVGGAGASASVSQKSGVGRVDGAWGMMDLSGLVGLVCIHCLGVVFGL